VISRKRPGSEPHRRSGGTLARLPLREVQRGHAPQPQKRTTRSSGLQRRLDALEALEPPSVVAGHKIPDHDDDPQNITVTRQYIRDLIRIDQKTDTPRAMLPRSSSSIPRPRQRWRGVAGRNGRQAAHPNGSPASRDDGGEVNRRLSPARPLTLPAPSQVQAASTSRVHGGKGRSGTVTDRKMVSGQARRVATTVGLDPSTTQGRSDIHALNYMSPAYMNDATLALDV
jgi:hypothetical protein